MKRTYDFKKELVELKDRIVDAIKQELKDNFNGRWDLTDDDEFDILEESTELYEIEWWLKSIYVEDDKLFADYECDDDYKTIRGELLDINRLIGWLERLENKR